MAICAARIDRVLFETHHFGMILSFLSLLLKVVRHMPLYPFISYSNEICIRKGKKMILFSVSAFLIIRDALFRVLCTIKLSFADTSCA